MMHGWENLMTSTLSTRLDSANNKIVLTHLKKKGPVTIETICNQTQRHNIAFQFFFQLLNISPPWVGALRCHRPAHLVTYISAYAIKQASCQTCIFIYRYIVILCIYIYIYCVKPNLMHLWKVQPQNQNEDVVPAMKKPNVDGVRWHFNDYGTKDLFRGHNVARTIFIPKIITHDCISHIIILVNHK